MDDGGEEEGGQGATRRCRMGGGGGRGLSPPRAATGTGVVGRQRAATGTGVVGRHTFRWPRPGVEVVIRPPLTKPRLEKDKKKLRITYVEVSYLPYSVKQH